MVFDLKAHITIEMAQSMYNNGIAVEVNNGKTVDLISEEQMMEILVEGELIEVDYDEYQQYKIDKANGTHRDQHISKVD